MSHARITAQLQRVQHPSAVFRRQAVVGLFHLLRDVPESDHRFTWDTVLECLSQQQQVQGFGLVLLQKPTSTVDVLPFGLAECCANRSYWSLRTAEPLKLP